MKDRFGKVSLARCSRLVAAASVAAALLVATATTASTTAGASKKYPAIPPGPITFGVSASLSGATAAYGVTTKLAEQKVTLPAFDALFPKGIDGHQVNIQVLDDQSTVTGAVSVANQFASEHVAGVLSVTYNPEGADDQYDILNKAKVPVISVLSGSQFTNTKDWPYDFSFSPSNPQIAVATAKWIAKQGYARVATLNDGVAQDTDFLDQLESAIKADAPHAKIVKSVTIAPGAVEVSAAVAQLKASNANLLIVTNGEGYGPIWQAMLAADWSPEILASPGAWYDGFTAMGSLVNKAVAYFYSCVSSPTQTWSAGITSLMSQYAAITGDAEVNYLDFVESGIVPLEIFKYAIEKYDSVSPQAIKAAIEGLHGTSFEGFAYDFSPTNHYGSTGQYGAAVCHMGKPYAGGKANVPVKSS
jgi:branched-chain amino acid transport system substrate-binding protein